MNMKATIPLRRPQTAVAPLTKLLAKPNAPTTLARKPLADITNIYSARPKTAGIITPLKKKKDTVLPKIKLASAIKERNQKKMRCNFSRISKYLHIVIFDFLPALEVDKLSSVCRNLRRSSF